LIRDFVICLFFKKIIMKKILYILLAGIITAFLPGCEQEPEDLIGKISEPAPAGARIKLFHAVPAAPAVEVTWKGQRINANRVTTVTNPVFAGMGYGGVYPSIDNDYALLTPGSDKLVVRTLDNPNAVPPATSTQILSADAQLAEGKSYTLIAYGTATAPLAHLQEDVFPPNRDNVYVRFFNACNGSTTFDFAATGTPAAITGLEFGKMSDYISLPVTSVNQRIQSQAFTSKVNGPATPVNINGSWTDLGKGRCYTVIVRGTVGTTGATAPTVALLLNRF
jgi:Domain of unknown function (DUF4397)